MTDREPSWTGELRDIVKARMNGRPVLHEKVTALLRAVISSFTAPTDDHGVCWSAGAWRAGFEAHQKLQERADRLAGRLQPGPDRRADWRYISRSDVFARSAAADLFLAALAFGFGTTGYGWLRTLAIHVQAGDNAHSRAPHSQHVAIPEQR